MQQVEDVRSIVKNGHISLLGVVLVREIGQSTDPCVHHESTWEVRSTRIGSIYTVIANLLVGIEL